MALTIKFIDTHFDSATISTILYKIDSGIILQLQLLPPHTETIISYGG